jgi:uncharacterized protein YlxW (UPF0749 family)
MARQPQEVIARIRELRRRAPASGVPMAPEDQPLQRQTEQLRAQVAQLEQLVQGLQDSVDREFRRRDDRLAEIEKRIDPAEVAAALSRDARRRGI